MSLSPEKIAHDKVLLCAAEASQLTQKIIEGALRLHNMEGLPFGGLASGMRRVAARLETIGTDNEPDMREFAKGELNWTTEQKNGLAAALVILRDNSGPEQVAAQVERIKRLFFPETKSKSTFE